LAASCRSGCSRLRLIAVVRGDGEVRVHLTPDGIEFTIVSTSPPFEAENVTQFPEPDAPRGAQQFGRVCRVMDHASDQAA
jgi:hypothetical protein